MASATIQEYLVSLGFKVDEAQQKKFNDSLVSVNKQFLAFGLSIVAAYEAFDQLITKTTRSFETLYYASQRTGDSVKNLNALQFGFEQIGLSAEQALSAIGSFSLAIQKTGGANGGLNGLLKQLGIGGDAGSPEQFLNMIEKLNTMNFPQAAGIAQNFGIDAGTLRQYEANLPVLRQSMADFSKRQGEAGVDPAKLSEESIAYRRSVTTLTSNFQILSQLIAENFVPVLTKAVDALNYSFGWLFGKSAEMTAKVGRGYTKEAYEGPGNKTAPGAAAPAGSVGHNAGEVVDYFMKQGWSRAAAVGIAANIAAESSFNPNATGDGGKAFGLAQWHDARAKEFKERFGHDLREGKFEEQLAFIDYTLKGGQDQGAKTAGKILSGEGISPAQAAAQFSQYFERPRDREGEMAKRAAMADAIANSITQHNNVVINGAHDPHETGRQVGHVLQLFKRNAELRARNLHPNAQ